MSRPGDPGREQVVVSGAGPEVMADLVALLRDRVGGVRSWDLAYEAADRELGPDEEPDSDEATLWTVTVVVRRRWPGTHRKTDREFVGRYRCEPGGNHHSASIEAMAQVLEQLGANVVLL